ncbi:MAG: HD domain-containing protein [Magnetococcales bacterium]|nr:HD domain-containing protein [Magnetococcales bacterium]
MAPKIEKSEDTSPKDGAYAYDLHNENHDEKLKGLVLKNGLFRPGEDQHFVAAGTPISEKLLERLRAEATLTTIHAWSAVDQASSESMARMDQLMAEAQETSQRELAAHLHNHHDGTLPTVETITNALVAMKKRGVFDFVKGMIGNIEQMVDQIMKDLDPNAIHGLKELRGHHPGTGTHSVETGLRGMTLAKSMGADQDMVHQVGLAGFVHDLGKLLIPLEILDKKGRLTKDEFEIVKSHALYGGLFFSSDNIIDKAHAFSAGAHHEAYSLDWGYGILTSYAKSVALKLSKEERQRAWEITNYLAISDVWTALGEPRSYHKEGKFEIEILMIMADMMWQKKFHPTIFKQGFIKLFDELPRSKALLRKGIHFPLFSFPKKRRMELEQRFNLPKNEQKLSLDDLERMSLWRMVQEAGIPEERVQRHKGVTVYELLKNDIMVTPKRLEQADVIPKKVDYRMVFTDVLDSSRVKAMLLKIDDTPLELQKSMSPKDGIGLDAIQRYLFKDVGQFELDMSEDMNCPNDAFLDEIKPGFS